MFWKYEVRKLSFIVKMLLHLLLMDTVTFNRCKNKSDFPRTYKKFVFRQCNLTSEIIKIRDFPGEPIKTKASCQSQQWQRRNTNRPTGGSGCFCCKVSHENLWTSVVFFKAVVDAVLCLRLPKRTDSLFEIWQFDRRLLGNALQPTHLEQQAD